MRCWVVTVGEPLPLGDGGERRLRSGILSQMLAEAGHEVTWWTASFDHWRKAHRTDGHAATRLAQNYSIVLLWGRGYSRNISLERIGDHRDVARAFRCLAANEPKPDVIIVSLPTLELSVEAVRYGKEHGVPVVVDVRDMWPDVMLRAAPKALRPLARIPLLPMRRLAREACRDASAITGHMPAFVEWGLRHAERQQGRYDRHFPFGYESASQFDVKPEDLALWAAGGVRADQAELTVCLAATLSHSFDFRALIDAARRVDGERIRFVICGTGDNFAWLRDAAMNLSNVTLPGWVGRRELLALFSIADVGIAPYRDEFDFRVTIPNKGPEYLAAGLPIALSLPDGPLLDILAQYDCGFSYRGDGAELARHLRALRDDRTRLSGMRARARQLYSDRFRAEQIYGDMVRFLEDVARDKPRVAVT